MSIEAKHIVYFGAADMPEVDTGQIGGAADKSRKITFEDIITTGVVSVVAEDIADTSIALTVYGRDASGASVNEVISTHVSNGRTKVAGSQAFERILKVSRASASNTGALAVMSDSDLVTGTAVGGGTDYLTLESGDQQADDYYKGWVVRMTGGTNVGQLREVVKYVNSTNRIYVRDWDGGACSTDTYELGVGVVLEHSGQMGSAATTIDDVRRPFLGVASDPDSAKIFYTKVFCYNVHASQTLDAATIEEDASGAAELKSRISFGVEDALNDTDVATNRVTAPDGYSFGNGPTDFANTKRFTYNSGQGVWMKLELAANDVAINDVYAFKVKGQTV